jgi:septum formation protein
MLILASQSPRRKELLEQENIKFKMVPSHLDETIPSGMTPIGYVRALAKEKALSVFKDYPNDLILGADTIVLLDDEILGKPENDEDAFRILKKLIGQRHFVYTAVTLLDKHHEESWLSYAEVRFKDVKDEDLWAYIKTKEPVDKAGAYAIQGFGSFLVQSYYGDYYCIVGLPIKDVKEKLKLFDKKHLL